LRESNLHPGDELEVITDDGDIILRKARVAVQEGLLKILHTLKELPIPERERSTVRDVRL
jgi:bifunctional DNA-binding transcriptional regulator/antitoxin component of YhaV-PrlF toxin-antitoxin module